MRVSVAVVWGACLCGRFLAGEDAPADPTPGAVAPANENEPEPEALAAALARKVSFEFEDTPLEEGLDFLVSLSKAPPLRCELGLRGKEISLKVQNVSMRNALEQFAGKAGAKVYFVDGAYWLGTSAPVPTKDLLPAPKEIPALTDGEKTQARAAIKALGADDYADRDAARLALRKLGLGVLPVLREAHAVRADDPERRTQVAALIKECEALQEAGPLGLELALALKRPVTLDLEYTTLGEIAEQLSGKTMPVKAAPSVKNMQVTGRFHDVPLGAALRWFARLSGTTLVYAEDGITFAARHIPGQPTMIYGKP